MHTIILRQFAGRVKAGLILNLMELINIKGTVYNNKTCYSFSLWHYSLQSTLDLPSFVSPNRYILHGQFSVVTPEKSDSVFFHTFLKFKVLCLHWSIASELSCRNFLSVKTGGSLRTCCNTLYSLEFNARILNYL